MSDRHVLGYTKSGRPIYARAPDAVDPVDATAAMGAGLLDPMNLTSSAVGLYSPSTAAILRDAKARAPIAAAVGELGTGGGLLNYLGRVAKPVAGGLAGLVGMTGSAKTADGNDQEFQELRRSLVQETPDIARLRRQVEEASAAVRQSAGLEGQAAGSKQMTARAASTANARTALAAAEDRLAEAMGALNAEASRRAEGIMMGRAAGRKAQKEVLDSQPRPFFQQYEALRTDLPFLPSGSMLPVAAGALGGLSVAGKALPASWIGRANASKALEAGDDALAQALAQQHKTKIFDKKVLGTGSAMGATAGGLPVGADAYSLPTINPEKQAGRRYVDALLDIDPRKEAERARIEAMSDQNPAKLAAQDPVTYLKSMTFGALEGAGGAKFASVPFNAFRPEFSNVEAALNARKSASPPLGGGTNRGSQTGPPPNVPRAYDPYRDDVRAKYRVHVADEGLPPNPSSFNQAAQLSYGAGSPGIPNIVARTRATNQAMEDFVKKHNRKPKTSKDYDEVFKATKTLGLAGAAAAPLTLFDLIGGTGESELGLMDY